MMDIQRAIEWQKSFKKTYNGMPKEVDEVCDFAISAFEELEQYRQIGTVKDVKNGMEELSRWHTSRINKKIKNPNKNAKIPDVAKAFGVKTDNLFYMMRQLGIRI